MELVSITKIKPARYNPRVISDTALTALVESVRKFGMPQPLVVNRVSGNLVSGHQRLKAAEIVGMSEVPVVYVELDDAAEKALNVTLNNKAVGGEFTSGVESVLSDIESALGPDFMRSLRLDEINIPTIDFDEPEEKREPEEKEAELNVCPNCGVTIG
jgi:ParB-like chromosome segregation protein Spo0J